MKKITSKTELRSEMPRSALSAQDLAAFLEGLAQLQSSPKFGNIELSLALLKLAQDVRSGNTGASLSSRNKKSKPLILSDEKIAELKNLDNDAIHEFLVDKSKTKSELIALASARFSMPTSQLKRSRTEEVRAAVATALLHEASIQIISSEADKDGAKRTS